MIEFWAVYGVYLFPVLIFLLFCAAAFVSARWLGPFAVKLAEKLNRPYVAEALRIFVRPAAYCLLSLGVLSAVSTLPQQVHAAAPWLAVTGRVCAIACIVFFTVGLVRAVHIVPALLLGMSSKLDLGTGKALAHFLTSILQAFIFLVAATIVLDILGYNINGVLTALGLGSLSFALAGQDIVSNIFGGIIIITERPFEIGDWVKTADVEGSVEDISLRSTKIRTLDDALTVVPNQKFTSAAITNWTRLNRRLSQFTLGFAYATPADTLQLVCADLRGMLAAHPQVLPDTVQVRFLEFGASSLDVFVQFYVKTTQIAEYRAVREEINAKILEILQTRGASLAFPSRSVYLSSV